MFGATPRGALRTATAPNATTATLGRGSGRRGSLPHGLGRRQVLLPLGQAIYPLRQSCRPCGSGVPERFERQDLARAEQAEAVTAAVNWRNGTSCFFFKKDRPHPSYCRIWRLPRPRARQPPCPRPGVMDAEPMRDDARPACRPIQEEPRRKPGRPRRRGHLATPRWRVRRTRRRRTSPAGRSR